MGASGRDGRDATSPEALEWRNPRSRPNRGGARRRRAPRGARGERARRTWTAGFIVKDAADIVAAVRARRTTNSDARVAGNGADGAEVRRRARSHFSGERVSEPGVREIVRRLLLHTAVVTNRLLVQKVVTGKTFRKDDQQPSSRRFPPREVVLRFPPPTLHARATRPLHARRLVSRTRRRTAQEGSQRVHRAPSPRLRRADPAALARFPDCPPEGAAADPAPARETRAVVTSEPLRRDGLARRHPETPHRRAGGAGHRHRRERGCANRDRAGLARTWRDPSGASIPRASLPSDPLPPAPSRLPAVAPS